MALDVGLISAAIFAAVFWWLSAAVPLPAPKAYFDQAPDNDPFFEAIKESARLSGVAARLAAISAGLAAIASWVRRHNEWPPPRYRRLMEWITGYRAPP